MGNTKGCSSYMKLPRKDDGSVDEEALEKVIDEA